MATVGQCTDARGAISNAKHNNVKNEITTGHIEYRNHDMALELCKYWQQKKNKYEMIPYAIIGVVTVVNIGTEELIMFLAEFFKKPRNRELIL